MTAGISLIQTLGALFLIVVLIQLFLRRNRKIDKKSIRTDWQLFLKASKSTDIPAMIKLGEKLIWNKYLTQAQLSNIMAVVDFHIEKHPELQKLKLDAYNKQLHYDRILPESGSSGGIKQSW